MHRVLARTGVAALVTLAAVAPVIRPAHAQSTALRWIVPYTGQSLVVDPATQHVFVLSVNGGITMLSARTGARLQQATVAGAVTWGAGVVDGQIARALLLAPAIAQGTRVVLLNTQSGAVLNTLSMTGAAGFLAEDTSTRRVYISESDPSGTIAVVDARSGRLVDTLQVGAPAAQIAIDEQSGRLFVVTPAPAGSSAKDTIHVVDLAARKVVGTVPVGHGTADLAVDGATGHVFVTGAAGRTISVIDGRNLHVLTTAVATTAPGRVLVDAAHARAYVLCRGSGQPAVNGAAQGATRTVGATVDVLDTRTGNVLLRIPVGAPAADMALDRQTGNLFVAIAYTTPVNTYLATPYALVGSVRVITTGSRPTLRTVLWPANTAPVALAMDEVDGRVYSVSTGSTTTSAGMVAGFTAMLDETRL
ncbi:MAG TPA: YncE family protein [Chloroflexota bacterium]|nr:YncE family protein [Chloroflexota bacterium]